MQTYEGAVDIFLCRVGKHDLLMLRAISDGNCVTTFKVIVRKRLAYFFMDTVYVRLNAVF